MLEAAAILCFLIGLIHSCLGERFILIRLFRGDRVPHLFGSGYFPKRTFRFAWHITTFACGGLATRYSVHILKIKTQLHNKVFHTTPLRSVRT